MAAKISKNSDCTYIVHTFLQQFAFEVQKKPPKQAIFDAISGNQHTPIKFESDKRLKEEKETAKHRKQRRFAVFFLCNDKAKEATVVHTLYIHIKQLYSHEQSCLTKFFFQKWLASIKGRRCQS